MWARRPSTVMLLKKRGDALLPMLMESIALLQSERMTVVLEPDVLERLGELGVGGADATCPRRQVASRSPRVFFLMLF